MDTDSCNIIIFPTVDEERGCLSFVEDNLLSPYSFGDFYFAKAFDIISKKFLDNGSVVIISICDIIYYTVGDAIDSQRFSLCPLSQGLFVPQGTKIRFDSASGCSDVMIITLAHPLLSENHYCDFLHELSISLPFRPRRVFFTYNVPCHGIRGSHAHKETMQYLISLRGVFHMEVDALVNCKSIDLLNGQDGVYVSPNTWITLSDFSADAVCMGFADTDYDENDYITGYKEFKQISF